MPSTVFNSSTNACARAQSPFASHHRAASGAESSMHGASSATDAVNSAEFISALTLAPVVGPGKYLKIRSLGAASPRREGLILTDHSVSSVKRQYQKGAGRPPRHTPRPVAAAPTNLQEHGPVSRRTLVAG